MVGNSEQDASGFLSYFVTVLFSLSFYHYHFILILLSLVRRNDSYWVNFFWLVQRDVSMGSNSDYLENFTQGGSRVLLLRIPTAHKCLRNCLTITISL